MTLNTMKTTKFTIATLFALAITVVACKKEDEKDTTKPTVTVTLITPSDNGAYHNGNTVEYKIEAADETELHGVVTTITRDEDNYEVFHNHDHDVEDKSYSYTGSVVLDNGGLHTNFTIKAVATDASDNEAEASQTFHSHPM